eukprot:CAMPEP_0179197928 /NCGR_PEP_ID=MMETSP0796-20121207/98434_1 /TAXON_ID=73915 /ORGANISM="Pyrodinium bahamense, Strain pbaha01" /LENGTH=31 /DNA_ID= /DNA_START= /DNA_END= /DNA_ORIENTATION=
MYAGAEAAAFLSLGRDVAVVTRLTPASASSR